MIKIPKHEWMYVRKRVQMITIPFNSQYGFKGSFAVPRISTYTLNDAQSMLCFTADKWQQRCGRIDSKSFLKGLSDRPDATVIQEAAGPAMP